MSADPNLPPPAPADRAIDWLADGTPYSRRFGDVYYSRDSGIDESRYVFLERNALEARWRALPDSAERAFVIGETGFGTGLNFLLARELWERVAPPRARLVFRSLEAWPLEPADLARAQACFPALAAPAAELRAAWPPALPGLHTLEFAAGRITLQLFIGDVAAALRELAPAHPLAQAASVDAWFLDGFAPARNPAMWDDAVLAAIARASRPGTTLATFSSAAAVRHGLAHAGFEVRREPGFGRKRHMLSAVRDTRPAPSVATQARTPWHLARASTAGERHALVIGAGIAGSTAARALARRGWSVTVLDAAGGAARGASGNPQALLFTQLPAGDSAHGEFTLHSYLYALRFHAALLGEDTRVRADCGLLQFADDAEIERLAARFAEHPRLARFVDAAEASRLSGLAQPRGGIFLPGSGWIVPGAACERALAHPGIDTRFGTRALALERDGEYWKVHTDAGLLRAPVVVIANGLEARSLLEEQELPLVPVRGQITLLPLGSVPVAPRCALSADGYVTPPLDGQISCGASFVPRVSELAPSARERRENLERLAQLLPGTDSTRIDAAGLADRVGLRATTPDRLPLAGPVPERAAFERSYAALARNARKRIDCLPPLLPGLFLSTGHGSRGMTSAPLCAELIAAQLSGEPLPVGERVLRALAPARFLLRAIVRGGPA